MSDNTQSDKSQGLLDSIKDVVSNLAETVKDTASTVAETVKDYVTIPPNQIADDESGKKEGQEFLDKTSKDTESNAQQVFDNTQGISKDTTLPIGEKILEKGKEFVDKASHFVHDAKESILDKGHQISDKAGDLFQGTKDTISGAGQQISDKASNLYQGAKDTIAEKGQQISEKASDLTQTAKDFIAPVKETLADATRGIAEMSTNAETAPHEDLSAPFDPHAEYALDSKQRAAELGQAVEQPVVKDFDQLIKEMAAQNLNPDLK